MPLLFGAQVSYEENVNGWKMGANGLWIIFDGLIEPHAKAHLFWHGLGMRSIRPWAQKAMIGSKKKFNFFSIANFGPLPIAIHFSQNGPMRK